MGIESSVSGLLGESFEITTATGSGRPGRSGSSRVNGERKIVRMLRRNGLEVGSGLAAVTTALATGQAQNIAHAFRVLFGL